MSIALTAAANDALAVTAAGPAQPAARTATGTGKDLPNLDVLRAAAVSCVLVSHILSALNRIPPGYWYGGFGGVPFLRSHSAGSDVVFGAPAEYVGFLHSKDCPNLSVGHFCRDCCGDHSRADGSF